jgi:hypothetical protein
MAGMTPEQIEEHKRFWLARLQSPLWAGIAADQYERVRREGPELKPMLWLRFVWAWRWLRGFISFRP